MLACHPAHSNDAGLPWLSEAAAQRYCTGTSEGQWDIGRGRGWGFKAPDPPNLCWCSKGLQQRRAESGRDGNCLDRATSAYSWEKRTALRTRSEDHPTCTVGRMVMVTEGKAAYMSATDRTKGGMEEKRATSYQQNWSADGGQMGRLCVNWEAAKGSHGGLVGCKGACDGQGGSPRRRRRPEQCQALS